MKVICHILIKDIKTSEVKEELMWDKLTQKRKKELSRALAIQGATACGYRLKG